MALISRLAGLVDQTPVNENQPALLYVVGLAVDKIIPLPLHQKINLIFIVQVLGGHGKSRFPADAVNGDSIHFFLIQNLAHVVLLSGTRRIILRDLILRTMPSSGKLGKYHLINGIIHQDITR